MKKTVLITVETILFIIVVSAVMLNIKTNTTTQLAVSLDGSIMMFSTFSTIIVCYFAGIISGLTYSTVLGSRYKDMIEFYSRKNEKLSQQNEADTDDKEALQRKIATLEIALQNALKNKQ